MQYLKTGCVDEYCENFFEFLSSSFNVLQVELQVKNINYYLKLFRFHYLKNAHFIPYFNMPKSKINPNIKATLNYLFHY